MNEHNTQPKTALEEAQTLAHAVEQTLAHLDARALGGLTPLEHAAASRIRHATVRLLQCTEQLAHSPFLIPGSTGQQRPHPLLKLEHDLRHEIIDNLDKLTHQATHRTQTERQRARQHALRHHRDDALARGPFTDTAIEPEDVA